MHETGILSVGELLSTGVRKQMTTEVRNKRMRRRRSEWRQPFVGFCVTQSVAGRGLFLAQTATLSPQECLGALGKPALSVALTISAVLLLL